MRTKQCTKCGEFKLLEDFLLDKRRKDGHTSWCRICMNINVLEWQKNNKKKLCEKVRRYYLKNKKKCSDRAKLYREEHKEQYSEYWRKRRIEHPEQCRLYNANHRNTLRGKLSANISRGIWGTLKGAKSKIHWEDLVGYKIDDLKKHLESKFTEGMTWENYGKHGWHIDHKIPIVAFNFGLPSDVDFKKCWSLSNLQPLWAKENCKKNGKLLSPFQPSLRIAI